MFKIDLINLLENRKLKTESCEDINLIIGGNNSGKTTLLNDIYHELKILHARPPDVRWTCGMSLTLEKASDWVEKVFPDIFEMDQFVNFSQFSQRLFIRKNKNSNNLVPWNHDVFDTLKETRTKNFKYEFGLKIEEQDRKLDALFHFLSEVMVVNEECVNRLNVSFNTTINNIDVELENDFIHYLYRNRRVFNLIKKNLKEVYGITIEFDNIPQGYKPLRIIIADINRNLSSHQALNKEWKHKSVLLDSVGHGIRSYLKLIFTLIDPTNQIIFIDEPETFIHPPQRRALGKFISKIVKEEQKQLFIATHDSEFIRGVLGSTLDNVKIFRLYTDHSGFHSTSINKKEISQLLNERASQLLNERILNSLFYGKTILCENENDRVIYEEAAAEYHWSKFHDTNFIGFNGHHDAVKFYNKLKQLLANPSVILDFDYLRTGTFPDSIDDQALENDFSTIQKILVTSFSKGTPEYLDLKKYGLKIFARKKYRVNAGSIKTLVSNLKKYGVFVVPTGELESWTGTSDLNTSLKKIRTKKIESLSLFMQEVLAA